MCGAGAVGIALSVLWLLLLAVADAVSAKRARSAYLTAKHGAAPGRSSLSPASGAGGLALADSLRTMDLEIRKQRDRLRRLEQEAEEQRCNARG